MSGDHKRILNPFPGPKKSEKLVIRLGKKYMPEERRQNLAETNRESYNNQEEWIEEFVDDKGTLYNGSESDDSDNDDENYNRAGKTGGTGGLMPPPHPPSPPTHTHLFA